MGGRGFLVLGGKRLAPAAVNLTAVGFANGS